MALDPNRFTRKTQEAFSAAQALARDAGNTEIAPEHLLEALLDQSEGIVTGVVERIGIDVAELRRRVDEMLAKLPSVTGATVRDAQLGAGTFRVLEAADAERTAFERRVHLDRAHPARDGEGHGRRRRPPPQRRRRPRCRARRAPPGARIASRHERQSRRAVPGAREVRARPHRGRAPRQDRSGHRSRRGDPSHHPGAVAPYQEQPGAHRGARRRQDRHRRRPGPADRRR